MARNPAASPPAASARVAVTDPAAIAEHLNMRGRISPIDGYMVYYTDHYIPLEIVNAMIASGDLVFYGQLLGAPSQPSASE